MSRNGRPPSMADVAEMVGVSHQTVSRVVNGKGRVSPRTRERVQAAIEQLGYRPNSVARALVTARSGIIGVVTTTSAHFGPSSMLVALEVAAREAGLFTSVVALDRFGPDDVASAFDHFSSLAAEAIAVAHEEGARVTAHCFGEQSVAELVAAGIDCIEHGTGMSDEVIQQMADRGVALVPTMINLNRFPQYAEPGRDKYPVFADHMMALYARRRETIGKAIEAGIEVHSGTDAGTVVPHGEILSEVAELASLGGGAFAIKASSWGARSWLGADSLAEGASADLIVTDTDPRADTGALRDPVARVLRGRVISCP